jgi:hypothetical protein
MIAFEVETEYKSIARSLSRWGPKGEPNAPIAAEGKVEDFLRQRRSCICYFGLL